MNENPTIAWNALQKCYTNLKEAGVATNCRGTITDERVTIEILLTPEPEEPEELALSLPLPKEI